jgi:cytidine deaminase
VSEALQHNGQKLVMQTRPNTKLISRAVLKKMRVAAVKASKQAYCPYSCFPVGAAVLTAAGRIFSGCNVENASYGLTVCAERNAIFHAVARGLKQIVAIAIYTPTPRPSTPCGACRQIIHEFGPKATVYSFCESKEELCVSMTELLKHSFGAMSLHSGNG